MKDYTAAEAAAAPRRPSLGRGSRRGHVPGGLPLRIPGRCMPRPWPGWGASRKRARCSRRRSSSTRRCPTPRTRNGSGCTLPTCALCRPSPIRRRPRPASPRPAQLVDGLSADLRRMSAVVMLRTRSPWSRPRGAEPRRLVDAVDEALARLLRALVADVGLPRRHLDLDGRHVLVGNLVQQVGDAVQARLLLVVRVDDPPRASSSGRWRRTSRPWRASTRPSACATRCPSGQSFQRLVGLRMRSWKRRSCSSSFTENQYLTR